MRPYLVAATGVMVAAVLFLFGYSFLHDKAEVARTLIFTTFVGTAGLLGYGWAICDRMELIAKVGTSTIRFEINETGQRRLSQEMIAELHDFSCHVLRHLQVPDWRRAVAVTATTAAPVTVPPPNLPEPGATRTSARPPAPRAAAICQSCGDSPADRIKLGNGSSIEVCKTCAPNWVPDTADLVESI